MSLLSYIKRNFRHRHMKRVAFVATISLEELTNIPFVNGVFFARLKMVDSLKISVYSKRIQVEDHIVKWYSEHELVCKSAVDPVNNTLENSYLKISIMQEFQGGKSSRSVGSLTINLAPFGNRGNHACRRTYIMSSGLLKKANCTLQISIKMCQKFGDPCFRVPNEEAIFCINAQSTDDCPSMQKSANFEFVITGDEYDEEEDDVQNRGMRTSITSSPHPITVTNSSSISPSPSNSSIVSQHTNSTSRRHNSTDTAAITAQLPAIASSANMSRDNQGMKNSPSLPPSYLGLPWPATHRRHVSDYNTPGTNSIAHRGSGPNFADDMSTALTLLNQKRICRSSTNCYEDVNQVTQFDSLLHPAMTTAGNNRSGGGHLSARLSRQELVNITRGSRVDIVDNVLQKVLQIDSPYHQPNRHHSKQLPSR